MARPLIRLVLALTLLGAAGCACCRRPVAPNPPPGAQLQPRVPPPPVPAPCPPPTPAGGAPAVNFLPPQGVGAATPPKLETNWQPAEGQAGPSRVQLAVPEPLPRDDTKLYPPESAGPEPPQARAPTTLPVGIPQFTEVRPNVAAGLRPSLDDGLDWLQANGYRSVLHLRAPGEDDSADRKQVEKRGLSYLSLEVSPATLTRAQADQFLAVVRDTSRQPLFVYDRDGSLAGPLWYLYFRLADNVPAEAARPRARMLGLREERGGAHAAMWLAVQRLLGENSR